MLVPERHKKIVQIINDKKNVRVNELSKLFAVTEETIRRDLEKLEAKNKLQRTHGGAVAMDDSDDDEIPFNDRQVLNRNEKMDVAKVAVSLIDEQDIIFLDASTTALYLAKLLPNMELTVLTNSLLVASELANRSKIQVIMTGGTLSKTSLSLVGPTAIRSIEHFYVDKVFFSCKGFHKDWGISDSNEQQANVKREMIKMSEQVILLLDFSKINQKSFAYIEDKSVLDCLIVDQKANVDYLQSIVDERTRIIIG
ncbi:DeoR/GlpR family DNA-binding transcription regulator [Viridibacillus sp. NPDC093762]|uniref:DeoR/GlpR family DNA-binding transcription regulator n=1 Tax=Viridibacillus sp. NPDC093762 TaxID=3390720 RepID=UPI003D062854